MTPWGYAPKPEEIEDYRSIIRKQYGEDEILLFEEAVRINMQTLEKRKNSRKEIDSLLQVCQRGQNVLIYGAGQRGSALAKFLKERTKATIGYVISDDRNKEEFKNKDFPVYSLGEVMENKEVYQFIVAAASSEVRQNLVNRKINYLDIPNYIFPFIKDYARLLCE